MTDGKSLDELPEIGSESEVKPVPQKITLAALSGNEISGADRNMIRDMKPTPGFENPPIIDPSVDYCARTGYHLVLGDYNSTQGNVSCMACNYSFSTTDPQVKFLYVIPQKKKK